MSALLAQQNLRRALAISGGRVTTYVGRPGTFALLVLILLVSVLPSPLGRLRGRQRPRPLRPALQR